ncbi:MAG: response regulator receiver protein [Acidimicrobiales bacterium]|nr:response regulator receiver protein [Acidimicrobiales bacterium]
MSLHDDAGDGGRSARRPADAESLRLEVIPPHEAAVDAVTTIVVDGDLDTATAPLLRSTVVAAMQVGPSDIVVDLGGTRFVDMFTLRMCEELDGELNQAGHALSFIGADAQVMRAVELARLHGLAPLDIQEGGRGDVRANAAVRSGIDHLARLLDAAFGSVVGISLTSAGGRNDPSTIYSSHRRARELDQVQYASGRGPCIEAATERRQTLLADVDDTNRWSELADAAMAVGVRSLLSTPLEFGDDRKWAANVYAGRADAFPPAERELIAQIAARAGSWLG